MRQQLDLWPYVAIVYGVCFLTLLSISIAAHLPLLHQPPRELAIFAALAIGPMLLGHTGMNWAVKFAPAFIVNLTVLGEPIGATVLGRAASRHSRVPVRAHVARRSDRVDWNSGRGDARRGDLRRQGCQRIGMTWM